MDEKFEEVKKKVENQYNELLNMIHVIKEKLENVILFQQVTITARPKDHSIKLVQGHAEYTGESVQFPRLPLNPERFDTDRDATYIPYYQIGDLNDSGVFDDFGTGITQKALYTPPSYYTSSPYTPLRPASIPYQRNTSYSYAASNSNAYNTYTPSTGLYNRNINRNVDNNENNENNTINTNEYRINYSTQHNINYKNNYNNNNNTYYSSPSIQSSNPRGNKYIDEWSE
ncbi:hypothetical protein WA158_001683 [Blastocystis sp. Blastoise]